jgi:predicted transcriptional regulator
MSETTSPARLRELTAQIVAAHISHNHVTSEVLLGLIGSVHGALAGSGQAVVEAAKQQPAVPVKRSVFPDHIVCLEDGKKLKMLKRHLMTTYHLTPAQYRQKWDLPASYPMVAPEYAARRSTLAKSIGLGRKPAAKPAPVAAPAPPARRGRPPRQAAAA